MPIKIPNDLPAFQTLEDENIFVIGNERALHQDIRALKIAIVNLMTRYLRKRSFCGF